MHRSGKRPSCSGPKCGCFIQRRSRITPGYHHHANHVHPPAIIFVMLVGMALASALLAGYELAAVPRRSWLHMRRFASMIAIAAYVILDIEYPRLGLVGVDVRSRCSSSFGLA